MREQGRHGAERGSVAMSRMTTVLALLAAFVAGTVAGMEVNQPPESVRFITEASPPPSPQTTVRPAGRQRREQTVADEQYLVRPGDTLWGIATRHYGNASTAMQAIKRRNGLRRDTVFAGEVLVLPATGRTSEVSGGEAS